MGDQFLAIKRLNSAVFGAYRSLLSRGEFPFFVLNLTIPHETIDVNVHPAKLEVRFQDEWRVYYVVKSAVNEALKDVLATLPDYNPYSRYEPSPEKFGHNSDQMSFKPAPETSSNGFIIEKAPRSSLTDADGMDQEKNQMNQRLQRAHERIEEMLSVKHEEQFAVEKIWQLHQRYLVTEVNSGLLIIDQHVAHERILFESAKKALDEKGFPSQTVLFPQTVKLLPEEFTKFLEIVPYLERIGFRLREFGDNTIIIDGVPPDVYPGSEDQIIRDILDKYMEQNELGSSFLDYIAATYACKAAIKSGDSLEPEEMRNLLDRLFATEHPYYCPHGRPIVVSLTIEELDRRFERI